MESNSTTSSKATRTTSPTVATIPEEYLAAGARYADRRGRSGGMAELGNLSGASSRREVLYPATSKLHGPLLASLITTPELDANYVQRFQHIAILAQLADALISVAQATGKCIVPVDFDPNSFVSPDDCSCVKCTRKREKALKASAGATAAVPVLVEGEAPVAEHLGNSLAQNHDSVPPSAPKGRQIIGGGSDRKDTGLRGTIDGRSNESSKPAEGENIMPSLPSNPTPPPSLEMTIKLNHTSACTPATAFPEEAAATILEPQEKRKSVTNSIYGCIDIDLNGSNQGANAGSSSNARKASVVIHPLPTPPETPAVDASKEHACAATDGILGCGTH